MKESLQEILQEILYRKVWNAINPNLVLAKTKKNVSVIT